MKGDDNIRTTVQYHIKLMDSIEIKGYEGERTKELYGQLYGAITQVLFSNIHLLSHVGCVIPFKYEILEIKRRFDIYDSKTGEFYCINSYEFCFKNILWYTSHILEYGIPDTLRSHYPIQECRIAYSHTKWERGGCWYIVLVHPLP